MEKYVIMDMENSNTIEYNANSVEDTIGKFLADGKFEKVEDRAYSVKIKPTDTPNGVTKELKKFKIKDGSVEWVSD